jgi:hypothetical protein
VPDWPIASENEQLRGWQHVLSDNLVLPHVKLYAGKVIVTFQTVGDFG